MFLRNWQDFSRMPWHWEKKPGFSGLTVGGQQELEDFGPCVFA
jgi:hypothetical protein